MGKRAVKTAKECGKFEWSPGPEEKAMEQKKKVRFAIVTAKEVADTGRLSFGFVVRSGMSSSDYFGFCEGRWAHLIDLPVDGRPGVTVNVYKDSDLVFGWGNDSATPEWIGELLAQMPSCAILMKKEYAEVFKAKCEELGYEYSYACFDGTLTTQ